jgi:hypothetical protein
MLKSKKLNTLMKTNWIGFSSCFLWFFFLFLWFFFSSSILFYFLKLHANVCKLLKFSMLGSSFCFVNCHGKFASQVLLSQDALTFHSIIILCYSHKTMVLQSHVPSQRTWIICEVVIKTLAPIITLCIMNQNNGHWLLGDTL